MYFLVRVLILYIFMCIMSAMLAKVISIALFYLSDH